ncbi:probable pectinesterase/pectinesterase inhibitor 20 [Cornus florida]|uniref:probable pectinesterase/pectinesterase inhibitor 20 n=1 Tax=Cornus florida TaxID=4283 RepID=UPI00289885C4|nr:probable pectinesterase/pectinesterase inhibitor 20 [Cornus florida]
MASINLHSTICILSLFLMLHFFSPFPFFCKSALAQNPSGTIFDSGRLSINRALVETGSFLSLINGYLNLGQTLSQTTIFALQDCQFLYSLNIDFLSNTIQTINSTNTLQTFQAEDTQTLLSAILTNQQTCLDGLQAINSDLTIRNALLAPLTNGTLLYGASLSLFTQGWFPDMTKSRWLMDREQIFSKNIDLRQDGQLPLTMSSENRNIYESLIGTKLLQKSGGNVAVSQVVVVNPNGSGNFTTINAAIAAAPINTNPNNGYFLIHVVAGVYEEYVSIGKNQRYLMMVGDGIDQTIITGSRSVGDGWSTFNTQTFAVVGEGFVAINITFRNTAGAIKHQAVAVRNGADLSTFFRCSFDGYQDTLYTHSQRQFYRECDIYGTVDFIFGNAAAVFQNCNIYPRLGMTGQTNTITAQSRTHENQNTGISIHNCNIRAASDLANSGNGKTKTFLGRPWEGYARTVFMQSFLDGLIDAAGWLEWNGEVPPPTLYYGEFGNTGAGSGTGGRVAWPGFHVMSAADAAKFTVGSFISGDAWLPATGVPFAAGLL